MARPAIGAGSRNPDAGHAYCFDVCTFVREFAGIVQNQRRAFARRESLARRLKMACKDLRLADLVVREKTIRRFCIGPVLADQRNALAGPACHLLKQPSKTPLQPFVPKLRSCNLALHPCLAAGTRVLLQIRRLRLPHACNSTFPPLLKLHIAGFD